MKIKLLGILFATLFLMNFAPLSFAAKPKIQKQVYGLKEPSAKDIQRGINQGFKMLTRLSKSDSYESFQNKARELKFKLTDPVLPQGYKNKMIRKIDALSSKRDKLYQKQQSLQEDGIQVDAKKLKAKKPEKTKKSSAPAKTNVMLSKEDRDADTRRIFKEVLTEHPEYKEDHTGLADAVMERKIKIVREREFLQTEFDRGVEKLYQKALANYGNKALKASKDDFVEVEKLAPNYKSVRKYLKLLSNVNMDSNGGAR